jgi:hypothetical protein
MAGSQTLKSISIIALSFAVLPITACQALSVPARSADSFVDSIGIAVHLGYTDTPYKNYDTIIKPRLQELGVKHIRDGASIRNTSSLDKFNDLAKSGIKSTLVMDPRDLADASEAVEIAKRVANSITAVEGPNELDLNTTVTYKGNVFPDGVRLFQKELYEAIKSDSTTSHLPVIGPSITKWERNDIAKLAGLPCDNNNLHLYPGGGWIPEQPDLDLYFIPNVKPICGDTKPSIATEMGYHNYFTTTPAGYPSGVPESISAKYIPRFFLKNFNRGIERSFSYELIDLTPTHKFGLLRNDGSPKPAFSALKNLIAILNNPAIPAVKRLRSNRSLHASHVNQRKRKLYSSPDQLFAKTFNPTQAIAKTSNPKGLLRRHTKQKRTLLNSLDFKLSGDITGIEYTLLYQNDKVYYLILWQAVESFSTTQKVAINVPEKSVKVVLATPVKQAILYNPLRSTNPISNVGQRQELNVSVPDHPLVFKLVKY